MERVVVVEVNILGQPINAEIFYTEQEAEDYIKNQEDRFTKEDLDYTINTVTIPRWLQKEVFHLEEKQQEQVYKAVFKYHFGVR